MKTVLIAVLAVIAAAVWFFSARRRRESRKSSLETIAKTMAVFLEEYGPDAALLERTGLPLFLESARGVAKNLFHFKDPGAAEEQYFFDFSYMEEQEGEAVTRQFTAALFDFKTDMFPPFLLSPDGSAGTPGVSGFAPADLRLFPGLPAGAKLYTGDAARLGPVLNPLRAALFAADPLWHAQGCGNWLLLYKPGGLTQPSAYHAFRDGARELATRLTA